MTADQSKYLIDMATRFQKVASLAVDARYGDDEIFNQALISGLRHTSPLAMIFLRP
jgi:hypothetical protein